MTNDQIPMTKASFLSLVLGSWCLFGHWCLVIGHLYVGQLPLPHAQAQGPDYRGLLAGGRADLLANSGTEARLRSGRTALGLHGDAHLVPDAHASRSRRCPAGLCGPAADDE